MTAQDLIRDLEKYSNTKDAEFLQRFFKTGKGQYGEGDIFIGVRMPACRIVAKKYMDLSLNELQKILDTKVHEQRMAALIILTLKYPKATNKHEIYDFYLSNVYKGNINNWDLIDVTTPHIIGVYLFDKPRDILYDLARSQDIWQKRVSVLATFQFIKDGDASTSLELAEILLHDNHDLIQKAVGWMLREIGKRCDRAILLNFLNQHAHEMPRTMLRYSIEHLPQEQKVFYMQKKLLHK